MSGPQWIDDEIDDDDDDFGEEEWEFDCAMMPDGQCGKAGSEECDWECPVMAEIHRKDALRRAKKAKE